MDYSTNTCTITNTVSGKIKEVRIMERGFKLPGDNVLDVNDDLANKWREELCRGMA